MQSRSSMGPSNPKGGHDEDAPRTGRLDRARRGAAAGGGGPLPGAPGRPPGQGLPPRADGRFVVLNSQATDLVAGDTNERWDVFVRDRKTGRTTRISVASNGAEAT